MAEESHGSAVDGCVRLVKMHHQRRSLNPQTLWPSVRTLSMRLQQENRTLEGRDTDLARAICVEIAAHAELVPFLDGAVSRVPGVMDRVVLYEDSAIVIRAHLFDGAVDETYVHNHGQAMISTCLEGSYVHRIYAINAERGRHYRFERTIGGILAVGVEADGELENVLCQPFAAGQSLFISALARHSVDGSGSGRVSTITIRDAAKRFDRIDIWSKTPSIAQPTDHVVAITDVDECHRIKLKLQAAVQAFRSILMPPPREPPVSGSPKASTMTTPPKPRVTASHSSLLLSSSGVKRSPELKVCSHGASTRVVAVASRRIGSTRSSLPQRRALTSSVRFFRPNGASCSFSRTSSS